MGSHTTRIVKLATSQSMIQVVSILMLIISLVISIIFTKATWYDLRTQTHILCLTLMTIPMMIIVSSTVSITYIGLLASACMAADPRDKSSMLIGINIIMILLWLIVFLLVCVGMEVPNLLNDLRTGPAPKKLIKQQQIAVIPNITIELQHPIEFPIMATAEMKDDVVDNEEM
jgi:hypothetical protein